jgi:hypothetical protein
MFMMLLHNTLWISCSAEGGKSSERTLQARLDSTPVQIRMPEQIGTQLQKQIAWRSFVVTLSGESRILLSGGTTWLNAPIAPKSSTFA